MHFPPNVSTFCVRNLLHRRRNARGIECSPGSVGFDLLLQIFQVLRHDLMFWSCVWFGKCFFLSVFCFDTKKKKKIYPNIKFGDVPWPIWGQVSCPVTVGIVE